MSTSAILKDCARLAGPLLRGDVAELLEPLGLRVVPRRGDRIVDLAAAAVHVDEVLRRRAAVPDQRKRDVRDVGQVAGDGLPPSG